MDQYSPKSPPPLVVEAEEKILVQVGPLLPMLGGNIELWTQLYWPTVHPAMQERKSVVTRDDASWELTKRLYEEGFSLRQVSEMTHVSPTTIRYRLNKQGVKLRAPGQRTGEECRLEHDEIRKTVFMYVEQELSCNEIAKILNISHSTVMWRLSRAGTKIRNNSEQQKLAWKKRHKLMYAV